MTAARPSTPPMRELPFSRLVARKTHLLAELDRAGTRPPALTRVPPRLPRLDLSRRLLLPPAAAALPQPVHRPRRRRRRFQAAALDRLRATEQKARGLRVSSVSSRSFSGRADRS
jgi:hypothetical protein